MTTTDAPPGINYSTLLPWFSEHVSPVKSLTATVVGHGRSNITYRLDSDDGRSWVLRRPPLSHVQATAHDMSREFRVISALHPTGFPTPKTYALCSDDSVLGAPFYIMEFVDGIIAVDATDVGRRFDEKKRYEIGIELVDVLARLHAYKPEEIGLSIGGIPAPTINEPLSRGLAREQQLEECRLSRSPPATCVHCKLPIAASTVLEASFA
jgi:aminoglycoside phosphotransferase (APT) family kinase protein